MQALTVVGIGTVVVCVVLIVFRRGFIKLGKAILTISFGEAVAEDALRGHPVRRTVVVGIFGIGFGIFMIINSLFFQ